jgi:vacuolar-type H+-ATPase subunit I/STV1
MRIIRAPRWANEEKTHIICQFEYDDGRVLTASVTDTEEGNPDWKEILEVFSTEVIDENTKKDIELHNERKTQREEQQKQEEEIAKQNILFLAKSEAFDLDIIRDSSYTDLKSNLRKASSLTEIHAYAGAIVALETLKNS